jgi:hypothetical protein
MGKPKNHKFDLQVRSFLGFKYKYENEASLRENSFEAKWTRSP